MTGEEFIDRFERGAVPAESFHHADHVRLAFAYLSRYSVVQALEKFATALKRFAAVQGKPQLYNETITFAYLFLIRERMVRSPVSGWEEFSSLNPDLLIWKRGILDLFYREETLKSELAKTVFLFPDKCG
jgi:hypothetical protein